MANFVIDDRWKITVEQKEHYMKAMTGQMNVLRAMINISQDELAKVLGISRQTYGAMESGARAMSWGTYLSLVLFYDNNMKTHSALRESEAFPKELFLQFNGCEDSQEQALDALSAMFPEDGEKVLHLAGLLSKLDDSALRTLRMVLLMEFARCCNLSEEEVLQQYGSIHFVRPDLNRLPTKVIQSKVRIRKK